MIQHRQAIEALRDKGHRLTPQRLLVLSIVAEGGGHMGVDEVFRRAKAAYPYMDIATVYRTVRLFEEAGIVERHDFGDGRARYEEIPDEHHDHLIDVRSGRVVEFQNEEIEGLQHRIAEELGYRLVGHRLELFAVPLKRGRRKKG